LVQTTTQPSLEFCDRNIKSYCKNRSSMWSLSKSNSW